MIVKTCFGNWCFDNGKLYDHVNGVSAESFFEPEFLERWVFAKFLGQDLLALGFETGQPFSESGSYGNRFKGTVVLKNTDSNRWECVSFECEIKHPLESYDLIDVAWHESVLARLTEGELELIFLDKPREVIEEWMPFNDSYDSSFVTFLEGGYKKLKMSCDGHHLYACKDTEIEKFDLWYMACLKDEYLMEYAREIISDDQKTDPAG